MVSADSAARSARLSTIRNSSMLWILPPRTPIVSTTGTPQAAILLPSHTPPEGCQPIVWPRSAPACLTSSKRASASGVKGLGGRPKPPCARCRHRALLRPRRWLHRSVVGDLFVIRRSRTQVDPKDGEVRHHIVGLPPSILAGLTLRPSRFSTASRRARSDAASTALRPSSGLRPAWAERPRRTIPKLPLPGRAPASVPSGSAAGSYVSAARFPRAACASNGADDSEPTSSSLLMTTS